CYQLSTRYRLTFVWKSARPPRQGHFLARGMHWGPNGNIKKMGSGFGAFVLLPFVPGRLNPWRTSLGTRPTAAKPVTEAPSRGLLSRGGSLPWHNGTFVCQIHWPLA